MLPKRHRKKRMVFRGQGLSEGEGFTKRHKITGMVFGICTVGLMGIVLGRVWGIELGEGSEPPPAFSAGLEEKSQPKEAQGPSKEAPEPSGESSGSSAKRAETGPDIPAQEETVFVADGKAELIEAVGSPWKQGEGYLEGSGPDHLLRTVRAIGSGDFHLSVELTLFQVPRSGASLVLGEGNHFGFSSGNARLFVEGPLFPGGQQMLAPTEQHIPEGRRFRLEVVRKENQMRFLIDGQVVYSMVSDGGPIGQVSLRPWRSRMRVHKFTATGHILDIPRSGRTEASKPQPGPEPASAPDAQQTPAPPHPKSSSVLPSVSPTPVAPELSPSGQAASPELPAPLVSAETAKPIEQIDVYISGQDGYHTYRIPSVLVTQKGTVLAFCEGRKRSQSDTGDINLVVKRSEDGGRTFSAQQVVWDDGPNTCGNPCPVVDQKTGTIWLLMTHNLGVDSEPQIVARKSKGSRTVWVSHSTDDGQTWSKPVEITQQVKKPEWTWYATGPGAGIPLRTGRLVIPCDHITENGRWWGSHVIYSDDGGKSWQLGGSAGPKTNECEVVELADGRLLLNMRNYHRQHTCRAVAFSSDGGQTWSALSYDEGLPEPVCQASIRRYSLADPNRPGTKNRILFSNPADPKERKNLTLRISYDEGRTWPVAKQIWPGPAAYSCLAVLPDGTVLCLYERGQKHAYERISLARIPAEEIESLDPKE